MTSEKNNDIPQGSFSQLITGLLVLTIKKELEEPGHSVLGLTTYSYWVVQRRYSFARDLERALNELKLTAIFLNEVDKAKTTDTKVYEAEELMAYHAGVFLDHVHQIKDKLIRLLDLVMAEGPWPRPYQEPKEAKIGKLVTKYALAIEALGIIGELERWQEGSDTIGRALKRRTQHHHYISRLYLDQDLLNVQVSRLMLKPDEVQRLSSYGVQYMERLGREAMGKLREKLTSTQESVIQEVESGINAIAARLIDYYAIPDQEEQAKIMADYTSWRASLRITNESKAALIPAGVSLLLDSIVKEGQARFGGDIVAVYLVGSAGRSDFDSAYSDINLYVITKRVTTSFEPNARASLSILSEEDFLSERHKRDRFICWSDGVLLAGKSFELKAKDFPGPGTQLALLLNRDAIEKIEEIKTKVAALEGEDIAVMRDYSLRAAKIMLDCIFGMAMANRPFYSSSRVKRIAHIKQVFVGDQLTPLLEGIYKNGALRPHDLVALIENFLANAKPNYEQMVAVENGLERG
jgi:hypothetical protein